MKWFSLMGVGPRLLGLALLATLSSARAAVVTIGASSDTTIFKGALNNSDGGGPGFFSGSDSSGNVLRSLLRFDVAAAIPAGSTVTGVQLTLNLGMVAGGGMTADTTPRTIGLYRVNNDWGEGTTGSSFSAIGGTGGGFAAQPGDATWNARFYDATSPTLWTAPGGDIAATASAAATIAQAIGPYSWNSTAALVADAQSWLDSPSGNDGWLLVNSSETTTKTYRAFWSREATNPALRPAMQITYTVPEPSTLGLVAIALAITLRRTAAPSARRTSSRG